MGLHGISRGQHSALHSSLLVAPISRPSVPSQPAWTPLGDTNLVFWGECDPVNLPGGYTLDSNGGVSALLDLNGSGVQLSQATAALRPTLVPGGAPSGLPYMHFSEAAGTYLQGLFTLVHPYHVFLAIRAYTGMDSAVNTYLFDGATGTCPCLKVGRYQQGSNVSISVYGGGAITASTVWNTWERWGAVFDAANSKFKINNTVVAGTLATNDPAPGGFTLGARRTGASAATLDVQSVLIYSAEKTGAALANIESYVKAKAGLVW